MKVRKRTYLLITILFVYVLFVLFNGGTKIILGEITENVCYLYNEDTNSLEGIFFDVVNEDKVASILNKLSEGDLVKDLAGVIPDELNIIYYTDDSRTVIVNFDDYYHVIDSRDELILRTSLVRSLTSYSNIDSVEIFVEGIPLRETNGESIGRLFDIR